MDSKRLLSNPIATADNVSEFLKDLEISSPRFESSSSATDFPLSSAILARQRQNTARRRRSHTHTSSISSAPSNTSNVASYSISDYTGLPSAPPSNATETSPHNFTPANDIQLYKQSQNRFVSQFKEWPHRSWEQYGHGNEAIPSLRRKPNFKRPLDNLNSTAKHDGEPDSPDQIALKGAWSQPLGYDPETSRGISAPVSHMASNAIRSSTEPSSYSAGWHSGSAVPMLRNMLRSPVACQGDQVIVRYIDDAGKFKNTGSLPHNCRMEADGSEPSPNDHTTLNADDDLESCSSEAVDSDLGLRGVYWEKHRRGPSLLPSLRGSEPVGIATPDLIHSSRLNDVLEERSGALRSAIDAAPGQSSHAVRLKARTVNFSILDQLSRDFQQHEDMSAYSKDPQQEHNECPTGTELEALQSQNNQNNESSRGPQLESCSTTKRTRPERGRGTDGEESDPDQNEERAEPTLKKHKSSCELPRFACPYQAFESNQNCLGPRARNSTGGCAGINRLKQHLNRRHKQAYRCQRCWSSFDSGRKARDHEEKSRCEHRAMLQTERFMSAQSEAGIERACKSVTAIEAWWNLFRLLIPGMQGRDIESLIHQFGTNYPFYFPRDSSLIIPPVTLSNDFFESVPQSEFRGETLLDRNFDHQDLVTPQHFHFDMGSTTYAMQPVSSQTLPMPVFEAVDGDTTGDGFVHPQNTAEASIPTQGSSSIDMYSPSSNMPSLETPFTAEHSASASAAPDQGHLRRNYERLRERNIQAEADNMALREAAHGAVADLNHLNNLVEELLNLEDLPDELFDKISKASATLTSARRKLQ